LQKSLKEQLVEKYPTEPKPITQLAMLISPYGDLTRLDICSAHDSLINFIKSELELLSPELRQSVLDGMSSYFSVDILSRLKSWKVPQDKGSPVVTAMSQYATVVNENRRIMQQHADGSYANNIQELITVRFFLLVLAQITLKDLIASIPSTEENTSG
jgi:hypothetical protein